MECRAEIAVAVRVRKETKREEMSEPKNIKLILYLKFYMVLYKILLPSGECGTV